MATQFSTIVVNQNAQRYVWRTSANNVYILMQDQGDFTNPTNYHMFASTNNGSTWAEADSAHKPASASGMEKGWTGDIDANGVIHMAMGGNVSGTVGYVTFNTATNLWGTMATAITLPTGVNAALAQNYLSIDKNGIPHIGASYSTNVSSVATGYLTYTNRIGGTWATGPTWNPNAAKQQIFGDFLIDTKDNIPIFISNLDDGTGAFGQLMVSYGNANNASSFSTFNIATGLMFSGAKLTMVQDDLYNTYVGYLNKTSGFQCLRKHVVGDAWTTWSSEISSGLAGGNGTINLTSAGRNIYALYTKASTGVALNMYNGQFWSGETLVQNDTTKTAPIVRYSNKNQYAPATIDYAMKGTGGEYFDTYAGTTSMTAYFDASDAAATDPNSSWTSPSEAFNGDLTTGAVQTVTSNQTTGFLKAEGTNAPIIGGPISAVQARVYAKGATDGAASWGSYTTLTAPAAGWNWQRINDLEVKIDTNAGASSTPGVAHAVIYTDTLAENLGTATYTSGANAPESLTVYKVELLVAYVASATYSPSHGTSAVKKITPTPSHTTDGNKRKTNTRTHTTSAVKRKQVVKTHTTDAVLKGTLTKSHTTDTNKRTSGITKTHTTDTMRHTLGIKTHTTDALKRTQPVKSHTTDALKRRQVVLTHTTDALKRKTNTRSHTADANKRVTGITRSHSTDTLKRKTNVLSHTTNAYIQPSIGTLSTDYFNVTFVPVVVTYTIAHSTDANKRKVNTVSHTTSANKRKTNTFSHTTDANKRKATVVSHTTDSLKRAQNTRTHSTDALKRKQNAKTHTTDSLLRKQLTRTHTTDANKRRVNTLTHTTDANKRKTGVLVTHTTDALKRKQNTRSHTTDTLKRTQNTKTHTTDSFLRRLITKLHTTDSLLRRQITRTQTTDALKRKQNTKTHTTDANKRKALSVAHTTDANKRKANTRFHTTDSLLRRTRIVSQTTDALKRVAHTLVHTTDSLKRKANTLSHSTSSLLRRILARSHTTDALKRAANAVTHATDANKRRAGNLKSHTSDALKRKINVISHSIDTLLRKINAISHTTSANKRKVTTVSHSTDSLLRKSQTLSHSTDTKKNRKDSVSHSTDTIVSFSHEAHHTTDASKYSHRGTKKVLINGVWHYGIVKVLVGSDWKIATVRYFNGVGWPSTED